MSFLDDIIDVSKTAYNFISGNGVASTLVKTIGTAYVVNQISKSIAKDNATDTTADTGVRLQLEPASENKIPVLYGEAYFGGIITDAVMTNTNKTMYYCITLSEQTGVKLSDSAQSIFTFEDIYWNDQRIVFQYDGVTADHTVDRNGVVDTSIVNQVKIWCYSGSSDLPATIQASYPHQANQTKAYNVMPNWTSSTHQMSDLVFAIVKVDYDKDKNITGLGNLTFNIRNSMKMPGDCIYDYMTNTRYGAGIPASEIYAA